MQHPHRSQAPACCHCCADMIETTAGLAGRKGEPSAPASSQRNSCYTNNFGFNRNRKCIGFCSGSDGDLWQSSEMDWSRSKWHTLCWSRAATCSPSAQRKMAGFCVGKPVLVRLCPCLSLLFLSLSCEQGWDRGLAGGCVCCTDRQQTQDHIMKL